MNNMNDEINQQRRNAEVQTESTSFVGLLSIIRRHIVLAAVVFVVILALFVGYLTTLKPSYVANAQIQVSSSALPNSENQFTELNAANSFISRQITLLVAPSEKTKILEDAASHSGKDINAQQLARAISYTQDEKNTTQISISATADNERKATAIANIAVDSLDKYLQANLFSSLDLSSHEKPDLILAKSDITTQPSVSKIKKLGIPIGCVFGIIFGIIAAILRELSITKVKRASEISQSTGAPVFTIHDLNDSTTHAAQDFTQIAQRLDYVAPVAGTQGKLFLFSSLGTDKVSSQVLQQCAVAMEQYGHKIAIVDANMANPVLTRDVQMEGRAGVSDVLAGQKKVTDIITPWEHNVDVVPAGPRPMNASQMLRSQAMKAVVETLLKQYDMVFFNLASLTCNDDAEYFVTLGGNLIIVTEQDGTKRHDLRECATNLAMNHIDVAGYIFMESTH